MDGTELVETVRSATATELDRLGSEKALVAATDARLETDAVLEAAAGTEALARDTFRAWADDEGDERAREAFAAVAATEADHHAAVVAELDAEPDVPEPDALHEHLRGLEGTAERVGAGLVGRSLASERSLLQFVNYFVNEGDAGRADLFRGFRGDTADLVDRGAALLDGVCETDDEWAAARAAAERAIELAYGEYASSLEEMGVDPKPVC